MPGPVPVPWHIYQYHTSHRSGGWFAQLNVVMVRGGPLQPCPPCVCLLCPLKVQAARSLVPWMSSQQVASGDLNRLAAGPREHPDTVPTASISPQ